MFEVSVKGVVDTGKVNFSSSLNLTDHAVSGCQGADSAHPEQLYVNLSTFWYCFLALITTIGLLVSLISNMIIIYLFTCLTQSTWILEKKLVCQAFGFITVSTALASILTVLAMSIERAVVIKYSIHVKDRFTIRFAWIIIVIIWFLSLVSCLPPLFGKFNRYTLDPSKTSCTLDYLSKQTNYRLYILALAILYWIAPAIMISISYILIIITFKRSSLSLKKVASEQNKPHLSSSSTASSPGIRSGGTAMFVGRRNRVLRDSIRLHNFISGIHRPTLSSTSNDDPRSKEELATRRASASALDLKQATRESVMTMNSTEWGEFTRVASSSTLPLKVSSQTNLESQTRQENSRPRLVNPLLRLKRFSRSSIRSCQLNTGLDTNKSKVSENELHSSIGAIFHRNLIPLHRGQAKGALSNVSMVAQAANSQLTRTMLQFRLAKMSFYLILLWLISWTPIASLAFINSIIKCHQASATAVFMASTMTKLGPAFDVFIYGISHPKIKSKFKQIIKWLFMMGSHSGGSTNHEQSTQLYNVASTNSVKSHRANSIET